MEINIKKYAQISSIAINQTEEVDITKGVLDILNYVAILENISETSLKNTDKINDIQLNSRYRIPEKKTLIDSQSKEIIFDNAPRIIKNYFVVPNLIIRKS